MALLWLFIHLNKNLSRYNDFLSILIGNNPVFVQTKAWRQTCDKSLSEPMMAYCTVTWRQCVNWGISWIEWRYKNIHRSYRNTRQTEINMTFIHWVLKSGLNNQQSAIILCVELHQDSQTKINVMANEILQSFILRRILDGLYILLRTPGGPFADIDLL